MKITELKGKAQVFTLKNGSTFRISPRETRSVTDSLISGELKLAESMGLVMLTMDSTVVPKNKKSGGTK